MTRTDPVARIAEGLTFTSTVLVAAALLAWLASVIVSPEAAAPAALCGGAGLSIPARLFWDMLGG